MDGKKESESYWSIRAFLIFRIEINCCLQDSHLQGSLKQVLQFAEFAVGFNESEGNYAHTWIPIGTKITLQVMHYKSPWTAVGCTNTCCGWERLKSNRRRHALWFWPPMRLSHTRNVEDDFLQRSMLPLGCLDQKKSLTFSFLLHKESPNETSLFSSLNIHDTAEVPALINLNSSFVVFLICFVDSMLLKLRISLHLFFFPFSLQNSIKCQVSIVCYASPKGLTWANGASVGHQKASKRESCEKVCVQLFSVSSAELI